MGRILVFGSINLDMIAQVDRLPAPGETVRSSAFAQAPGGKGANQALAARRAGANVEMCGAVGDDAHAEAALHLLRDNGVGLSELATKEGSTGIALIFVEQSGENMITIVPGANGKVDELDAEMMLQVIGPDDILLCQQEVPTSSIATAMAIATARGARVLFNTAPINADTAKLAALADVVVANETEFDGLAGVSATSAIRRDRLAAYADQKGQTVIVTLGADGLIAAVDNTIVEVAALPITPVDTVGAGDTFCGYLAVGLLENMDWPEALSFASAAASLACTKSGAQPAIPSKSDVLYALSNGPR